MFTDSATMTTDSEFDLTLSGTDKTHVSVDVLRVFTKPAFWNPPPVAHKVYLLFIFKGQHLNVILRLFIL